MTANKTETQDYKILQTEKDFEIRFYTATTMATITLSAKTYKELANSGFRKLAGFIFGGNEASKQIPMTSPVHMDINDTASSMSFVMPKKYDLQSLPKPNDASVQLKTTNDEYIAAISFSGYADDNSIKEYSEKLKLALDKAKISYFGPFRYLGYNAPYQLIGRKNEIIVKVDWQ